MLGGAFVLLRFDARLQLDLERTLNRQQPVYGWYRLRTVNTRRGVDLRRDAGSNSLWGDDLPEDLRHVDCLAHGSMCAGRAEMWRR